MKKLAILLGIVLMASTVTGLEAVIQPSSPDDIVLDDSNSFQIANKTFDGSASTPSDEIKTYSWDFIGSSQSESGLKANFTFDRDSPRFGNTQSVKIRLTVSDGTNSDVDEITPGLYDKPEITYKNITKEDIDLNNSDGEVSFSAAAKDTFDGDINYTWSFDGNGTVINEGPNSSVTFTETGDYKLFLNVTDSAGYYTTWTSNQIDVTKSTSNNNNNDTEEDTGGGGGDSGESFDEIYVLGDFSNGDTVEASFSSSPITDVNITVSGSKTQTELKSKSQKDLPDGPSGSPDEKVYKYIELKTVNFSDSDIGSVSFKFEVDKDWVADNNIIESDIKLQRYHDDQWNLLDTTKTGEDNNHLYFEASSPGLSVFAISASEKQQDQNIGTTSTDSGGNDNTGDKTSQEDSDNSQDNSNQDQNNEGGILSGFTPLGPLQAILVLILGGGVAALIYVGSHRYLKEQETPEEKLDRLSIEIERQIRDGNLDENEREMVVEKLDHAEDLIDEDDYEWAVEELEKIEDVLEDKDIENREKGFQGFR